MASYPTERELAALRVWSARAPRILELLPGFRSKWENLSDLSWKVLYKGRTSKPKIEKGLCYPFTVFVKIFTWVKNRKFQSKYPSGDHIVFIQTRGTRTGTHTGAACLPPRRLILSLTSNPHFLTSLIDQDELWNVFTEPVSNSRVPVYTVHCTLTAQHQHKGKVFKLKQTNKDWCSLFV